MKLAIFALISLVPLAASATERCGRLGMEIVGPVCHPHELCPQYRAQQFFLVGRDGSKLVVETAELEVLEQFADLKGGDVCVTGSPSRERAGAFEVSSIRAQQ